MRTEPLSFDEAHTIDRDRDIPYEVVEVQDAWDQIPFIPDIDQQVYKAITEFPERFDMSHFHTRISDGVDLSYERPYINEVFKKNSCGTAHCLAGWACVIAGRPIKILRRKDFRVSALAAAIFLKGTGSVPNFFQGEERALAEMRGRVGVGT